MVIRITNFKEFVRQLDLTELWISLEHIFFELWVMEGFL